MNYGIPAIIIKADGTEKDYIDNNINGFICEDFDKMIFVIKEFKKKSIIKQKEFYLSVLKKAKLIDSERWVNKFLLNLNNLRE
jgi:hypothetical protein